MSADESDAGSETRSYQHIEHLGYGEDLAQEVLSNISKPGHDVIIFPADQSVHLIYDPSQVEDGDSDE